MPLTKVIYKFILFIYYRTLIKLNGTKVIVFNICNNHLNPLNLLFERNSKTVELLQKRADKAKETASEIERQLKETLGGD